MSKKMALGRGLGALIEDAAIDSTKNSNEEVAVKHVVKELVNEIEVDKIDLNPYQPRTHFDEDALRELSDSIQKLGVIQPITVRAIDGRYQLISGERRLRAVKLAGLKTVPAFTRTTDDQGMLEMALVENIQRGVLLNIGHRDHRGAGVAHDPVGDLVDALFCGGRGDEDVLVAEPHRHVGGRHVGQQNLWHTEGQRTHDARDHGGAHRAGPGDDGVATALFV